MNNKFIVKVTSSLIIGAAILTSFPIPANAEWHQDNTGGWWYTEGNSYVKGWKEINEKWYYFNNNGRMLFNTITPDGYVVNIDGSWDGKTKEIFSNKKTLEIKQQVYNLGTTSIDLCIYNNTNGELYYDNYFVIEKLENDKWVELPFSENAYFKDILNGIGIGTNYEEPCNLTWLKDFDNLTSGKYRVVKNINNENMYAEFELI